MQNILKKGEDYRLKCKFKRSFLNWKEQDEEFRNFSLSRDNSSGLQFGLDELRLSFSEKPQGDRKNSWEDSKPKPAKYSKTEISFYLNVYQVVNKSYIANRIMGGAG